MNEIVIRQGEPGDYARIREIFAQPRAVWGTLQLPLPSEALWKQRMEDPPEGLTHLVALMDEIVVGELGLHAARNMRRRHVAALGMAVHDEWQGKGVGTALMKAAIDLADNWLNFTRLELTVFVDNEPAIALYKKCGFEIEGTHQKYAFRGGEFVDTHAMARVK
jgi:putative acetyltransferase